MAKIYIVQKDGETLKELKTLAAAKKLADAEGADVLCEGECAYQGNTAPAADPVTPTEEMTVAEEAAKPTTYMLLRKMNVRKAPSLKADKAAVLNAGAEVLVTEITNDWLHLADGTFILYEGGKNARKAAD